MDTRAEALRQRIAAYRCYLKARTDAAMVRQILREIATDEAELSAIRSEEEADGRIS
jgi:hypothetical protein